MKEYYIAKGEEKTGPFSLDEMKIQIFYADTLIWKEGWHDWIKASDVPELQQLINSAPPPIKLKEDAPIEDEMPNISILILSYFFGWVIAPIYIIYRIAILFIGSDEKPVEFANSNVTIKRKEHEN